MWLKKWLLEKEKYSDIRLLKDLACDEPDDFKNYLRMEISTFNELLKMVTPMRNCITAEERLTVTLRFLATGRSYECLNFSYGISPQSLGRIIPETCAVIFNVLKNNFFKMEEYLNTLHFGGC
ncbi:hypothetical protein HW555_013917 [Spodoptera exigua]|uniref:Nuclease HARBI1 n=1 Tax=Spodoptera exigua TaxID=7107 RepID=A0A835G0Q9_SPOEX|nr:hypothetical protein HW555_013917 [Spodoptera exigua]